MLARASTKTFVSPIFVSRVQKTAKKSSLAGSLVSRGIIVIRNVVQVLYNYGRARYNVMKVVGYFVSLLTRVVINENIVMVNSQELIGTTDVLTLYTRYRINRCRYNRV